MIKNYLKNNNLIICNNDYKLKILNELNDNKLYNIKFMSLEEYKKNLYFDYDYKTIKYLVDNYNYSISNSKVIIDSLYYINDNINYSNNKLDYLNKIKKELDSNNLLIYNKLFNINNYDNILIYGYGYIEDYTLSFLKLENAINLYYNDEIKNNIIDKKYSIYEFNMIEDEMEYVFDQISILLNNNIDINNIFIICNDNKYNSYLKRFSKLYNININIENNDSIIGTKTYKDFKVLLNKYDNFNDLYNNIEDSIYRDNFVNIINKYIELDYNDSLKYILYDLNNLKINNNKYINCINLVNLDYCFNNNDYVFIIGFNSSYPKTSLDIDYIGDLLIENNNIDKIKTINKNINCNNNIKLELQNINNLYLSYSKKSPFDNYFKSNLIDDLNIEIKYYNSNNSYSNNYNKVKYGYLLDEYDKYGLDSNNKDKLDIYYSTYKNIGYNSYNNKFSGLNKNDLNKKFNKGFNLSYTSINDYYECSFKYYLKYVLRITDSKTFFTDLGSLFHAGLENMNKPDFDIDSFYDNYVNNLKFEEDVNKNLYFFKKLKPELIFTINVIKEHMRITGLNNELHEQNITIDLGDNIKFTGFVDKILYTYKDNMNLISVIDYKTGTPDIDLNYLEYGLKMQLPIYMYLIKHYKELDNPKFMGFYLQKILDFEINRDRKKTLNDQKKEKLKLTGFTNSDKNYLEIWDSTYENSEMIKSLKVNNDGNFNYHSKVLNDQEIESIIDKVEENVLNAKTNILNGEFNINPKLEDKKKNISCSFCKFNSICYFNESDYDDITIEKKQEKNNLEGDE